MRTPTTTTEIARPFEGYLTVRRYAMMLKADGTDMPQATHCNVLSGPGHNVSLVAVLLMRPDGRFEVVLKAGDTRPARVLRGEPYVKMGTVGGRLDQPKLDAAAVARHEVQEELGATVVDGGLVPLGDMAVATMPAESSEADMYFVALARFDKDAAMPQGDGGGMELVGLMRPIRLSVQDALRAMDEGKVGEGGRARTVHGRAFDRLGYIPALDRYVFDLPEALKTRFDTLGLGQAVDLRHIGEEHAVQPPPTPAKAGSVNDVKLLDRVNTHLEEAALLVNARVSHAVRKNGDLTTVGDAFRVQFLHLPYDRVKLVVWTRDEKGGPKVLMEPTERLPMAIKNLNLTDEFEGKEHTKLNRMDLLESRMHVGVEHRRDVIVGLAEHAAEAIMMAHGLAGTPTRIGGSVDASPGQSDMRYHLFQVEVPAGVADQRFVPIAEAFKLCRRDGQADATSEALLLRLADHAEWIPTLDMSIEDAKKALG